MRLVFLLSHICITFSRVFTNSQSSLMSIPRCQWRRRVTLTPLIHADTGKYTTGKCYLHSWSSGHALLFFRHRTFFSANREEFRKWQKLVQEYEINLLKSSLWVIIVNTAGRGPLRCSVPPGRALQDQDEEQEVPAVLRHGGHPSIRPRHWSSLERWV